MIRKKLTAIISLVLIAITCFVFASCGQKPETTITKELPQEVVYGDELYLREYIPLEYGTDYELSVSYVDKLNDKTHTDEKLDSLMFRFDAVAEYTFKFNKVGGDVKEFKVTCKPEKPILTTPGTYRAEIGEELYLTDIIAWCGLKVYNNGATVDPDFKWNFVDVTISEATVDGKKETVSLDGKTSFKFESEATYEFNVKAENNGGFAATTLVCSNINEENHNNTVTGYVMKDKKTIEFEVPSMADPADKTVVKTRIGDKKYDAVYNASASKYVISNVAEDYSTSVAYRVYVAGANGSYSTQITVPDLVITKDNIHELELITKGTVIIAEDIDMTDVAWGAKRAGLKYSSYWFAGTLDGLGHTISNFKTGSAQFAGSLLWSLQNNSVVKNIIFDNAIIDGANGLISSRTHPHAKFENIAVKLSDISTTNAGVIAGPSDGNIGYKNCLMYVAKDSLGEVKGTGLFGGLYSFSVNVSNVYVVAPEELPEGPKHSSIVTAVTGSYDRMTAGEVSEKLPENLGTKLLNKAKDMFFVKDDATHITKANIRDLELATTGKYVLDEDIDMADIKDWGESRVGKPYNDYFFSGTFDGQGHTIKNLNTGANGAFIRGLFYGVNGAIIKNVRFENATIAAVNNGLIAGRAGKTATPTSLKPSFYENIVAEVTFGVNTNVGFVCALQSADTFKNVLIYVKSSEASFNAEKTSCTAGLFQTAKPIVDNLYCVTDTTLTEFINAPATGTHKLMNVAEAKAIDVNILPTQLLKDAVNAWFKA